MLGKRLLLGMLLLLFALPPLQSRFHWLPESELGGAFHMAPHPNFSWDGLTSNNFQTGLEKYLEDRIGFRGILIRMRNQLGYSVFQESWANRLAVGRNDVLFEQEPIEAWLGNDYVGDDEVRFNARRFRSAQDSLAKHGVQLVFVIAPSKATFMPENLPRYARRQQRSRTNYQAYAQALAAAGVHMVDFSQAFQQWKRTTPYPLFASGGTHWSMYGGTRAADSLVTYLKHSLGVTPAAFRVKSYEVTNVPRYTDDDIARTMNLLFPLPAESLAYPQIDFPASTERKPNLLLVADSFGWTWMYLQITNCFSDQTRYWYYNSEVGWPGPEATPEGRDLGQLKNRAQYLGRDVIVVMFNERNLSQFDKGFSQEVYNIFHPYTPSDHARYQVLVQELSSKSPWEEVRKEGFEQRISAQAKAILDRER